MKTKFDSTKYYRDRYKKDPEFRKQRIKLIRAWQIKNQDKINTYHRKRYANRTPKQIQARKLYLKKLRANK